MKELNAIKVSNIKEMVDNKYKRLYTPFQIEPDGNGYYIDAGIRIPQKEFEAKYPTELKPLENRKGKNYDRTKNWIHGEKSY